MSYKETVKFKSKFYFSKKTIDINNVYIQFILVSKKYSLDKDDFSQFVDYKNYEYDVTPLLIRLPKLTGYIKGFQEAKYMIQ